MGGTHITAVPFGKLIGCHGNAALGSDLLLPVNMDIRFVAGIVHEDEGAEAVEVEIPANTYTVLRMATGAGEALP